MLIKLSDYIAKRLKEHGVEHLFMVSGGGAMHLNDSLGHAIPFTANHNEQASSFSAEGYARVNQKLAVVNVTTGPGGLNCMNGLFGEWTDSVPVMYISGQVKRRTMLTTYPDIPLRQLGDQEVDIISVVKSLTKYAVTVEDPNDIKYHLDRAVYEATTGRFGPVWINIPIDVQASLIDEENLREFLPPKKNSSDCKIEAISEKLKTAKRPLIIAGHGIRLSGQIENFYKLIEQLKIPVVTTFNGFDIMNDNNPYYVGRIGTIGQRAGNFALQNADLILCLGTRNNIRQVSYNWENFGKNAFKIVVDIDRAELDKPLVVPDMKINADLADFIGVSKEWENVCGNDRDDWKCWLEFCKNLKNKYSFKNHPEHKQGDEEINPYYFTKYLTEELKERDILVSANATPSICIFQVHDIKGERVIMNSGDASMGFALPASIGAYYSKKDDKSRVVCFEGDGSIMMNIQELQTVVTNKIPLKIFVINNGGYSSIQQTQKNFFDGRMTASGMDSGVGVPDFVEVAKAFGLKTKRIDNPKTMREDIKDVLNSDGAILCEVITEKEYAFLPKLSSKKFPDGTMVSPSLEDMYPFLKRDEFEKNMLN